METVTTKRRNKSKKKILNTQKVVLSIQLVRFKPKSSVKISSSTEHVSLTKRPNRGPKKIIQIVYQIRILQITDNIGETKKSKKGKEL